MNGLLAIASILDPMNKLDCVDFYFREIYKGGASWEIERVTFFLYDLLVEYQDKKVRFPLLMLPDLQLLLMINQSIPHLKRGPLKNIVVIGTQHTSKPKRGRKT